MLKRIKAVLNIGIIESFKAPVRNLGVLGLIIDWGISLATTVLPFCLFLFGAIAGLGIGWYVHFAIFFEICTLLIANEREITDYRSLSQFPLTSSQVLLLRMVRRFINPTALLSTGLFIASLIITYKGFFNKPTAIISLIITTIAVFICLEDVQLWKEKAGKGNIINSIFIVIFLAAGIAPFFAGRGFSPILIAYAVMNNHWWWCFATLAISVIAYFAIIKIPQSSLDGLRKEKTASTSTNIIVKAINAIPSSSPLKQLIIKDYRLMMRSNIALLINVAIWVLLSWLFTKNVDFSSMPYLRNEWVALCYAGVIVQIYGTMLTHPFAGDSYGAWVTLLSPIPRKLILLSKNIVIIIAGVLLFVPMSVFVFKIGSDFTIKKMFMWLVLYLAFAFIMSILLNRSLVSTKMKMIKKGKRNALVNALLELAGKLMFYAVAILISIMYQIIMDSKYSAIAWVISVPLLIISAFIWYFNLESQVKYINKYTQGITESLVIS